MVTKKAGSPDPKVLAKLAELAGIRDLPFPLIKNMHGVLLTNTNRQEFEHKVAAWVYVSHHSAALTSAAKLKEGKKIGQLARDLTKALKTSDQKHLAQFLPHGRTVDPYIADLNDLADAARWIGRLKKAPRLGKARITSRNSFVKGLLDAAHDAGGRLTLNQRNGRGSLVEAVGLLSPYLPDEISAKLSVATLKRVRRAWAQKLEK